MNSSLRLRAAAVLVAGAALSLPLAACNKSASSPAASSAGVAGADGQAPSDGSATLVGGDGGSGQGGSGQGGSGQGGSGQAGGEGYATPTAYSDSPPPPLPDYEQPPIPGDGYLWTPGYWDWDENAGDYYWAPGTWVRPPRPGLLWTPGYWRFINGRYGFSAGYWGPRVGFYGGVNYGYGYGGEGYLGGRWQGDSFAYNQTVNNLTNVHVANVFRETAARRGGTTSFNGGPGGLAVRPTPAQIAPPREVRLPPTGDQTQHLLAAKGNPLQRAGINHGHPTVVATSRPGVLEGPGVVTAGHPAAPAREEARPEAPRAEARPAAPRAEARPVARPAPLRPVERVDSPPPPTEHRPPAPPRRPEAAARPEGHPVGAPTRPPEHAAPRPEAEPHPAAPPRHAGEPEHR